MQGDENEVVISPIQKNTGLYVTYMVLASVKVRPNLITVGFNSPYTPNPIKGLKLLEIIKT